jgi:hypothetical protein
MSRPRIEMQKPIAEYASKLLGRKVSHSWVCYHAKRERAHRMPLTWEQEGYSWVYKDELEAWVRGYQARRGRSKPKREQQKKKATSRR